MTSVAFPVPMLRRSPSRMSVSMGSSVLMASLGLIAAAGATASPSANVADANAYKSQPIPSPAYDSPVSARNQRRLKAKAEKKANRMWRESAENT